MLTALLKNKRILLYGSGLALMLFLLRWLELRFLVFSHETELYVAVIAILFTAFGAWLAIKLSRPEKETVIIEKEVYIKHDTFIRNESMLQQLNISRRELEVLELMAKGMSNAEIAAALFVSLNTVKTHSAKLFEKLEVNRRTQAVEKGRQLVIIA